MTTEQHEVESEIGHAHDAQGFCCDNCPACEVDDERDHATARAAYLQAKSTPPAKRVPVKGWARIEWSGGHRGLMLVAGPFVVEAEDASDGELAWCMKFRHRRVDGESGVEPTQAAAQLAAEDALRAIRDELTAVLEGR